jgi:CRISPR-associated protein Csb1
MPGTTPVRKEVLTMEPLSFSLLLEAVAGDGVGIRARTLLEPLGGPGDKLFPPTYGVASSAPTKYATEERRIDGETRQAVLLDSVASQANRFELALLNAYEDHEILFPLVSVDFRGHAGVADLDKLSVLETPHRIYDAILRDSLLGGRLFRLSEPGQAITEATPRNATALYRHSPTTLLFGGWDSTGPKGGRGSKFERTITSEIVGIGAVIGTRTASRIDPLGIERVGITVYETDDDLGWTADESEAALDDKGKPKVKAGGGEGPSGRPSQINHGNITPSIESGNGGVTVDMIVATTVLSFAALRRLRFVSGTNERPLDPEVRPAAEAAARTAIAALGLAATVLAFEDGFDLRSRCVLVPTTNPRFELLRRGGDEPQVYELDRTTALSIVREANAHASQLGLTWLEEELLLEPADRLVDLIERSRDLNARAPREIEDN